MMPPASGSLYIASTGIHPDFQGMGFGQLLKNWQVIYARYRGFERIVTNTRKSNSAMIALNRKFGFRIIRTTPRYYSDPVESTVGSIASRRVRPHGIQRAPHLFGEVS